MNARLRDPITVRSTTSGISILYHCSFGFFWITFYPSSPLFSSPFLFEYLPSAYLSSAQLWNISEYCHFHLLSLLSWDQILFWSPSPQSYITTAVEGNGNLEEQEGIEKVEKGTKKLRRETVGRLDEDNALENKITRNCHLYLQPSKRFETQPLCERGFLE